MSNSFKIAASAVVAALTLAFVACSPAEPGPTPSRARTEPTSRSDAASATPTGAAVATSAREALYAEGGEAFDAAAAAFPLPLPAGYSWPAGITRGVPPEAASDKVWYVWIAANADAARRGDAAAVDALAQADPPFDRAFLADVRQLIDEGDYNTLMIMFPMPAGMVRG